MCPPGWLYNRHRCYGGNQGMNKLNRYDASNMCQGMKNMNASLPFVADYPMAYYLGTVFSTNGLWLDIKYNGSDWVHDVKVLCNHYDCKYSNWNVTEPVLKAGKDCAAIKVGSNKWLSKNCADSRSYICEMGKFVIYNSLKNFIVGQLAFIGEICVFCRVC